LDERIGITGSVLDDRWDGSYPQTPHPPNQLLDEGNQSTYGLIAPLRDVARTMSPVEILARAAQAFIFAGTDAETILDRAAARTRGLAFADLAVTGRGAYAAFRRGVDRTALDAQTRALLAADAMTVPADAQVAAALDQALDRAYAVAWALNGPAAQQAAWRAPLGWIAVSSEDDKARRPVNVPAPPYDQCELAVTCGGLVLQTRFFVASSEPPVPVPVTPLPRDVPPDLMPAVPADHEVILFLHGHGSGAEEAVEIIPHLLAEAARRGKKYAIIAFDLPSNGYSESVDHTSIAPTAATTYPRLPTDSGPIATPVLDFIEDFVVAFVDAVDAVTPIKDRVAAVIGGSLGGNLGLRLGRRDTANGTDTPWLRNCSIVAWSPASVWTPKVQHTIDYMAPDRCMQRADEPEHRGGRGNYFYQVYREKELEGIIQPQPQYWYRGDWAPRAIHVDQSALARFDIYDPNYRRWHWRVAGEQLVYSHQDNVVHGDANTPVRYTQNTVRTLLVAGGEDDYIGTHIYDNTLTVGRAMTCPGYLLRVPGTGHSIHFERPGFFARKIVDFLAGKSMEITCVTKEHGKVQAVGGTNHTDAVPFRMSADDCMAAILGGDEFFVTDAAGVPAHVRITNTTPQPFLGNPGGKNLGYFLKTIADSSVGNNLDALPECP
jgi:pimeloyl-ACP methyl ester carboxylesterase